MRRFPVVANSALEEGVAALDARSAAHFGIGTAAGLLGVNPVLVILAALGYQGAMQIARHGDASAIMRRQRGESCLNQIMDVMLTVAGVYAGSYVRSVGGGAATSGPPALGCVGGCACGKHA